MAIMIDEVLHDMNARPRVVHVITGLNDGGAEASLFRLCASANAFEHHVISLMDDGKYGSLLRELGVHVYCLKMRQGQMTPVGFFRLWELLRNLQPKVVQTWMYHANLIGGVAARLAGIKSIFWGIRHGNLNSGVVKNSTILIARIGGLLSRYVPVRIISCSRRAVGVHVAQGYLSDRFITIPNGYDVLDFSSEVGARERLRAEWGISNNQVLIGMVARFDPQKDHANLLNALAKLKLKETPFMCALIGSGMDANNEMLHHLIEKFGLRNNIILLGRRDDIGCVMRALDLHALSSLGEAFPNVIAEAMICGTPCVCTDVGESAYIVGETGWIVDPGDSGQFANALQEALECRLNKTAWLNRQKSAIDRINSHFSIEHMAIAYQAVWNKCICG
jgi:glycosyltransferase involved in cell wall biosynthesis